MVKQAGTDKKLWVVRFACGGSAIFACDKQGIRHVKNALNIEGPFESPRDAALALIGDSIKETPESP